MSRQPRWEIVHTTTGWHARFRSSNGNVIVSSETYARRKGAVNAVALVGDAPSYSNGRDHELIEVRDVDERPEPLPGPVIEPPIWLTSDMDGRDYWHDQEIHYRNCYGNECDQADPPAGTLVQARFGRVAFKDERP